jgi:hypothetical protein
MRPIVSFTCRTQFLLLVLTSLIDRYTEEDKKKFQDPKFYNDYRREIERDGNVGTRPLEVAYLRLTHRSSTRMHTKPHFLEAPCKKELVNCFGQK